MMYHVIFIFPFLQVGQLRQRFYHSIAPGGLAADRRGVIPASGFCLSALQIWKVICENKDLNLPAHKVAVPFFAINSTKPNSYNSAHDPAINLFFNTMY
jgi:hypothetical protein